MNSSAALDWSLIQAVLAVSEAGSLSGAARELTVSQPTLGRQIRAAEAALGVSLFRRHAKGLTLTEEGAALIGPARQMQAAAARLQLAAASRTEAMQGTIRITASAMVAHYLLPPVLARIRMLEPQITLELHPSDKTENLLFGDADIAIRMHRPQQLDLITRHLGSLGLGIYAATDYLSRNGTPTTRQELLAQDWVGYDRSDLIIRGMEAAGWTVSRDFFTTRCDDHPTYWRLVEAGCGIGFCPTRVGRATPGVQRIMPEIAIPPLPIWLAAPETLHRSARLRLVWDLLAEGLGRLSDA